MSTRRLDKLTNKQLQGFIVEEVKKDKKNKKSLKFLKYALETVKEPSNKEKLNKILNAHLDVIEGMEEDGLPFAAVSLKNISKATFLEIKGFIDAEEILMF